MIPGMNSSANSADALLMWITIGAAGFGTEGSIVCHIAGGQASQNHFFAVHRDGLPFIIQHRHAGCVDSSEILLVQHPFMIAEGEESRRDGRTDGQEGQHVLLRFQRRVVILWVVAVENVADDGNKVWLVALQGGDDRRGIRVMEVGKQCQIWRSGDMVDCLFRRGSPPAVELTVKPGT